MNLTTRKLWLALSLLGFMSLLITTAQAAAVNEPIEPGEYQWNTAVAANSIWTKDGTKNSEVRAGSGGVQDEAVLNAQVSAVPVPASFWLFGAALLGFIGMSRRTQV